MSSSTPKLAQLLLIDSYRSPLDTAWWGPKMPPRSSLTSSFSISDANNEVVCPLRNTDGSSCRKRCIGVGRIVTPLLSALADSCRARRQEKRYRSMQEHIRRAHPEHYISKLPATEESFLLMINTPPSERPQAQTQTQSQAQHQHQQTSGPNPHQNKAYLLDSVFHRDHSSAPGTPRNAADDYIGGSQLPAANAAAALAQLHNHSLDPDWESEAVSRSLPRPRAAANWWSVSRIGTPTPRKGEGRARRLSCLQYTWTIPTSRASPSQA